MKNDKLFWGFNNETEARKSFNLPPKEEWHTEKVSVCSINKKCIGSFDGKEYMYDDGSKDYGIEIEIATVFIGNNKIKFEVTK